MRLLSVRKPLNQAFPVVWEDTMSLEEVKGTHSKFSSMFLETRPTQATGWPQTLRSAMRTLFLL